MAEPTQDSSSLLLLKHPLDTIEGVQEVIGNDSPLVKVERHPLIRECFPEAEEGDTAVLLNLTDTALVTDWARRHRAIYSPNLVALNPEQRQAAIEAYHGIEWPCWIFVYGELASSQQLSRILELNVADIQIRPAKIQGYHTVRSQGAEVVAPLKPRPRQDTTSADVSSTKLRPAQDVLKRLRHDPNFDQRDYQVVYEDRFEGKMVLDLELWKSDTSDEEFIPTHRILQFKRKVDDVIIWDRRSRVDLVFAAESFPSIAGLAIFIKDAQQGRKLLAQAPGLTHALPCVLEFIGAAGGTQIARTFR